MVNGVGSPRIRATSRRRAQQRLAGFAAALVALCASVGTAGADPVTIRAEQQSGYGRIVFGWPAAVPFQATLNNDALTLVFERPVQADLSGLPKQFSAYVSGVRVLPDGRTVVLDLTKHFLFRSSAAGTDVVIDLLGQGIANAAPPPPAPAPPATQAAAAVPAATPAAAPAAPRAAPVAAAPAPPPAAANATVTGAKGAVGVRVGEHDGYDRIVFDWTQEVPYTAVIAGNRITVDFSRADGIDLTPLSRTPLAGVKAAAVTTAGGHTVVTIDVPAGARLRHFRSEEKVVVDVRTDGAIAATPAQTAPAAAPAARVATPPAATAAATPRAAAPAPPPPQPAVTGPTTVRVTYSSPERGIVRVSFARPKPGAMAAFQRAGYLWVVFDGAGTASLPPIPEEAAAVVQGAERIASDKVVAVRFKVSEDFFPVISQSGNDWTIDLLPDPAAGIAYEIVRQNTSDLGAVVVVTATDATPAVELKDPEVGDSIFVVPVAGARHAMTDAHDFTQFKFLPTAQGIAVERRDDRVRVTQFAGGVAVTAQGGLFLSPVADGTKLVNAPQGASAIPAGPPLLLKMAAWAEGHEPLIRDNVRALQASLSVAPDEQRTKARLALAQYYMGIGFWQEAIGVLAVAADMNPAVVEDPLFRAMRGVTEFKLDRIKDATSDLNHRSLDNKPEMAAWRGALFANDQKWDAARTQFNLAGDTTAAYPQSVRVGLALAQGQTALALGDAKMLAGVLAALDAYAPDHAEGAAADLLRGQAFAFVQSNDDALKMFDHAIESGYKPYSLQAQVAKLDLQLKGNKTTLDEATKVLDHMLFDWRGDDFEFSVLARLGDLYLQNKDYRGGLTVLREAVALYPDQSKVAGLYQRMNDLFANLFLKGGAEAIPAVTALALYYDFRELTPVGADGDEMVRRLADRLASVDLLAQAAELLEYQVTFRLRGEDKARIAARLATIYLLNRNPQKAFETIRGSQWRIAPADLLAERSRLEARALLDLKKPDEALAAIQADRSRDAQLVRADIYWRTSNWIAASQALDAYLGDRWQQAAPLNDEERRQVMREAVTLVLAGDKAGTARLRGRYFDKMKVTKDSDAFDVVTNQTDPSTIAFRQVAEQVARLDSLQSFKDSYLSREPAAVKLVN